MPELRQNIATREWVIIATERAKKPQDFISPPKEKTENTPYSPSCPFCPGNEEKSREETFSIRDSSGRWLVRSTPNKFPALAREGEPSYRADGTRRWMNGVGLHDVIIECPEHHLTTALLDPVQVLRILQTYKQLFLSAVKDPRVEQVTLFKNHGAAAGTSQSHPHSQMVATPVVPSHIRDRVAHAMNYYDEHRECVFCRMIREEQTSEERIVLETDHFIAFVPYAAFSPFHTWLLPKRHQPSFPQASDDEMEDLARVLQAVLKKLYVGLDNPDFNYVMRCLPGAPRKNAFFHWYLSIVPRVSKAAGFELGSGMYINTSLPEESAQFLRNVKIQP
jgi:UDPglucose--hexose-1-phosphate uridylyltransferase